MKLLFLPIPLLVVGVVYADPMPPGALVWSGTYTFTYDQFGLSGPPEVSLTPAGVETGQGGMGYAPGLFQQYTVDTGFTVTTPGEFVLSSSGSYGDYATNCNPVGCGYPYGTLDASFSATVDIGGGPDGFSLEQSLSGSGSTPYIGDCDLASCADIQLSDNKSDLVDLMGGTYNLEVTYQATNDSEGDNFGGGGVNTYLTPTPTPEPRDLGFLIAGVSLVILVKLRARVHVSLPKSSLPII